MKHNIWSIEAVVTGIKKRERKIKRHYIKLAEIPDDGDKPLHILPPSIQIEAENAVRTGFREWQSVVIKYTPQEIEDYNDMAIQSVNLFDSRAFGVPLEVSK